MRHKTKDKGDLGVAKTLPHLLRHDIRACTPLSEHLPFDLIAVMPDFTTLRRVQVKYRANDGKGAVHLKFRNHYYDTKHIYTRPMNLEEIDCFAVYCPETSESYYLRVDEIPPDAKSIDLRLYPAKSGRMKGVWTAIDFIDPRRIAPPCEPAPVVRRDVSEQDELALAEILADLVEKGVQPCLAQSHYLPFDLIAVGADMKTLNRVRVGYEMVAVTPHVDLYALYNPRTGHCFYVEAARIAPGQTVVTLEDALTRTHSLP